MELTLKDFKKIRNTILYLMELDKYNEYDSGLWVSLNTKLNKVNNKIKELQIKLTNKGV